MGVSAIQAWMSDVLHVITQGLLVPDIVLLIAFIAYALFCIGSVLVEYFTERKHFAVAMPKLLADLMAAEEGEMPEVIAQSGLLKRQKTALLTVYDYRVLPGDALIALIKRLVNEEESRYDRISGRNNMAARVSPMLGLMGTLIPLGPGIQALGSANTEQLSASLLIAFDTTVAGLVVAAICMIIGKVRSNWYGNYMSALDSAMATMLQKIEDMRDAGKIDTQVPSDYAFMFEQSAQKGRQPNESAEDVPHGAPDALGSGRPEAGDVPSVSPAPADSGEVYVQGAVAEAVSEAAPGAEPSQGRAPALGEGAPAVFDLPDIQLDYSTGSESATSAAFGLEALPTPMAVPEPSRAYAPEIAPLPDFAPVPSTAYAPAQDAVYDSGLQPGHGLASTGELPPVPVEGASGPDVFSYDSLQSLRADVPFTFEPLHTFQDDAPFTPVPDPAFISDLTAAAAIDAAPAMSVAGAAGAATMQGIPDIPGAAPVQGGFDAGPSAAAAADASQQDVPTQRVSNGWYQPQAGRGAEWRQQYSAADALPAYGRPLPEDGQAGQAAWRR